MAKIDWANVKREDVEKAIEIFLSERPEHPKSKSTFLIYDGKKLPAKHIRAMAYKVAYGKDISKEEFSGGMETVRFFNNLGFKMEYNSQNLVPATKNNNNKIKIPIKDNIPKIKISGKDVIKQKNKLQLILNKIFDGDVVCEKTFEWMKTPIELYGEFQELYDSIKNYRGDELFAKKNITLRCDFVCESQKIIIEYDERQHFSEARKRTLQSYKNIETFYDKELWIKACEDINAKDNNPINRDETRAYFDSIRDILAIKNGYKLFRIMHGQIDFTAEDEYEKTKKILDIEKKSPNIMNKSNLKIGLYLQTDENRKLRKFKKMLSDVSKEDFDILVLPEAAYSPYEDIMSELNILSEDGINNIFNLCIELSKSINKAIIISSIDINSLIFSVYANAFSTDNETRTALYIKHTMTDKSPFEIPDYSDRIKNMFPIIKYKNFKIGMTICYDSNHSIFSRIYGLKGVDIIINSTGGDVIYDKWYKYNKVRAIENNCYTFVTMGGDGEVENPHSYVYGFNPNGKLLIPINILDNDDEYINTPGGIYVYDISKDDGKSEYDSSIYQNHTSNKNHHITIRLNEIKSITQKSKKISDNIYFLKYEDKNIVFCLIDGNDIMKPEKVLQLLYDDRIKKYENKRYIIINRHESIDEEFYNTKLSIVLKVRAMENFCAVILESKNINNCYQTGYNRTAQVLSVEDDSYKIDLNRASGPEAIWKNKKGMKAMWRENFEKLIDTII